MRLALDGIAMALSPSRSAGIRLRWEGGTSLLEMMVVVSILSLGAAMAVPNYLMSNARYQLKQGAKELAGELNTARIVAMNRNATVTVTLAPVACPPDATNCGRLRATFTYPGGGTAMPAYVLPPEIKTAGGVSQVQFSSLGLRVGGGVTNHAMTVTNSKGVTFEIQVTPAGRIRWCAISPCT